MPKQSVCAHIFVLFRWSPLAQCFLGGEPIISSMASIGPDSIISTYPNAKSLLGGGSFGVVFATKQDDSRVAIKLVHVARKWQEQRESLAIEVMPLTLSAREQWKHVCWANKAFVHENLAMDLAQLLKESSLDGSPSASTNKKFWASLKDDLTENKKPVVPLPGHRNAHGGDVTPWAISVLGAKVG